MFDGKAQGGCEESTGCVVVRVGRHGLCGGLYVEKSTGCVMYSVGRHWLYVERRRLCVCVCVCGVCWEGTDCI